MSISDKVRTLTTAAVHEALAKTYGPKILERLKNDNSFKRQGMKDEVNTKPGKDLAEKVVSHLISKSPDPKYHRWMAHTYANGGINQLEDADKAGEALRHFHKHQAKLPNKDIQSYKSYNELADAVAPHAGTKSKSEENKEKTASYFKNGEATLVHDSANHRVVIPQTEEASKHFGKNTKWCTSAKGEEEGGSRNYFKDYKPKGNLFYFLDKKANKRHAIFVPHKQFEAGEYQSPEGFDEEDKPVSPKKIMEHHAPAQEDVEKHVSGVAHKVKLGYYNDPSHPKHDSSANEIHALVTKHVK
jgi:hypothetical protein